MLETIVAEVNKLTLQHHQCEDSWYSCPKSEDGCCDENAGDKCNCGAEEHNNQVNRVIEIIRALDTKE
jgi:hypothetical protein